MASYQRGSVIRIHQKHGDIYRFRWRENGVQRSAYLGTVKALPTLARAEKAADRFRRRLNTNVEAITVADLIAKFWRECPPERRTTAAGYRSIFGRIEERFGTLRVDALAESTVAIEQWLNGLETIRGRHRPASPLYKGQVRNLLHLLCEKAMLWRHLMLDRNPIELVSVRNASQRVKEITTLSLDQYQALLADEQLPEMVKVIIQVLASLGLRISECLGLRWEDFDLEAGTVHIRRSVVGGTKYPTKTLGSSQKLPVHASLIGALGAWKESVPVVNGWVFGSVRTGVPYDRDFLRSAYLQPAGQRCGIEHLGWHALRHTYRANLRASGASLEDQKQLMRHARLSTTIDTYGGEDSVERLRPANEKVVSILMGRSA